MTVSTNRVTTYSAPRPYSSFLTPALHICFVKAACVSYSFCYILGFVIGKWSLWAIAPLRSNLLFIPCFCIFMALLGKKHIGVRTGVSSFSILVREITSWSSIQSCAWCMLSCFLYAEVYMWYAGEDSGFQWIEMGRPYERPWLNERPVFLRTMFLYLGFVLNARYIYLDINQILLPPPGPERYQSIKSSRKPSDRIKNGLKPLVIDCLITTTFTGISGLLIYYFCLRSISWGISNMVFRNFLGLPRTSRPGQLSSVGELIFKHLFLQSFLCSFMLGITGLCFNAYLSSPLCKKGYLLTDDSSNPNGSLLQGLKSHREINKALAFYELALLSYTSPRRRELIYSQINDRFGELSMFEELLQASLDEISGILKRILKSKVCLEIHSGTEVYNMDSVSTLPKIVPALDTEPILQPPTSPSRLKATVDGMIKYEKGDSIASPKFIQEIVEFGNEKVSHRLNRSVKTIKYESNSLMKKLLNSVIGRQFQLTRWRQANVTICNSPYSESGIIMDAVNAITNLCIASLTEDSYGKVQKNVGRILRQFCDCLSNILDYLDQLPVHWSDTSGQCSEKPKKSSDGNSMPNMVHMNDMYRSFGGSKLRTVPRTPSPSPSPSPLLGGMRARRPKGNKQRGDTPGDAGLRELGTKNPSGLSMSKSASLHNEDNVSLVYWDDQVSLIIETFRTGIRDLLDNFGEFAQAIGLNENDIRLATRLIDLSS